MMTRPQRKRFLRAWRQMGLGRPDRLALKVDQLATIQACARPDGTVLVVESGCDCDGVQYDGRTHVVQAHYMALARLERDIAEWADGPFYLRVTLPDEAVKYVSRDRTLEAFEDGHAHCIKLGALI